MWLPRASFWSRRVPRGPAAGGVNSPPRHRRPPQHLDQLDRDSTFRMKRAGRSSSSGRVQRDFKNLVGKRPRGIRVTPDGKNLLVALSGSPIAVLASTSRSCRRPIVTPTALVSSIWRRESWCETRKVARTLKPSDLSPDGRRYMSRMRNRGDVVSTCRAARFGRGSDWRRARRVTVRPDGREVYVTCEADNEVFAIDTTTLKVVGRMKTAARPRAVVFTKDGSTAFVTAETAATVSIIDTAKYAVVASIVIPKGKGPTEARPMGAVL